MPAAIRKNVCEFLFARNKYQGIDVTARSYSFSKRLDNSIIAPVHRVLVDWQARKNLVRVNFTLRNDQACKAGRGNDRLSSVRRELWRSV